MGSSQDHDAHSATPAAHVARACPLFTEAETREAMLCYRGPPVIQPVERRGGRYRVVQTFIPRLPSTVLERLPLCVPADPPDQEAFYNGASVPFIAWWFLRPMEPQVVAGSLVHDMLYTLSGVLEDRNKRKIVVTRHFSDMVFLVLMFGSRYEPWRAWVTYLAVRTFSGRLFHHGQPLPPPSLAALEAEQLLNEAAWTFLTDRTHRGSFFRMYGVLFTLLSVGANTLVWTLRVADTLPWSLSVPLALFGLSITLTTITIPIVSVWWILDLRRRVRTNAQPAP